MKEHHINHLVVASILKYGTLLLFLPIICSCHQSELITETRSVSGSSALSATEYNPVTSDLPHPIFTSVTTTMPDWMEVPTVKIPVTKTEGDNNGLMKLIALAKQDLALRLSAPVELIIVIEAKTVVWPDASAGCPKPGMEYTQVQVEGVLIKLSYNGKTYEYHSGGSLELFLCEQSAPSKQVIPDMIDLMPPTLLNTDE